MNKTGLVFQAFSALPTYFLRLEIKSKLVLFFEHFPGQSRRFGSDIDPFDSWLHIGGLSDFDFTRISIPPNFKHSLFGTLNSPPFRLGLTASEKASPLLSNDPKPYKSVPSLPLQDFVEALRRVGCSHVRVSSRVSRFAGSLPIDMTHPARANNIWKISHGILTRGITLVRAESGGTAHNVPGMGELGRGFGLVDIVLPARADGIYHLRVVPQLPDALSYAEPNPRAYWNEMDERDIYLETLSKAGRWQFRTDTSNSECTLAGVIVEIWVRAASLDDAESAIKASGLRNWQDLTTGRQTGSKLETLRIRKNQYMEHFSESLDRSRTATAQMGDFDREEATRIIERLYAEIGYVDPCRYPPSGFPYFTLLPLPPE
ncbi:uncharacterized protein PFL1_01481 [Pseudozyma flocculosa PF-1]|uniref:Uncharacterized protein n=1 Tax=Pseudozyma flocculosa TaxID=84751 RepID=A0A5C3FDP5_9BASI|nr:uncharacterized protein PFL1_01481 [Pseudozyma flocculosa PF-1]EPQ31296.1 hypothetical protein PFL1_01481 [Pseudozyma flocculosa PF-1]SPO41757.1 uncharacterized protein PSFLO_07239 [Pseudozyma flocculosa]